MLRMRTGGFTMVELLIGLAIAALLIVLALPSYSTWIADSQIRNASESIAGGMRYAQSQAVARNSAVAFVLFTPANGWTARLEIDGTALQTGTFAEGSAQTTQTPTPAGTTTVTFSSLGGISPTNADASAVLTQVDVNSAVAGARRLIVLVGGGLSTLGQFSKTGIKICDPKWPATDPKGCPA
jgi:type IV fimbrial biogenesis protein FimT